MLEGANGVVPEDRRLLERLAAGDREALVSLIQRHGGAVRRLGALVAGSEAAGDDVLQETFLAALRSASTFRGDTSVRSWLFAIARHVALRERRRAAVAPVSSSPVLEMGLAAGWGAEDPRERLEARDSARRISRALDDLPVEDREILLLRDVEGLPGDEAAQVLGVSVPAMKSRLHRARLRLMAALRAAGWEVP